MEHWALSKGCGAASGIVTLHAILPGHGGDSGEDAFNSSVARVKKLELSCGISRAPPLSLPSARSALLLASASCC